MDCECMCHLPGHRLEDVDGRPVDCCGCKGIRLLTRWPPEGIEHPGQVSEVRPIVGEMSDRFRASGPSGSV